MTSPHTAISILEAIKEILDSWGIPAINIFRVLTDNGSNMVAAFKNNQANEVTDACNHEDTMLISDCDDDISDDELGFQADSASKDISEFEEKERDHNEVISVSFKRLSCFIHTLQLVVKLFETSPAFESTLKKLLE